jgi:hypothetical protein
VASHAKGTSPEPARGRPGRLGRISRALAVAPLAALAIAFAPLPVPALAADSPQFEGVLKEEAVYATRAHIAVEVFTGEVELEWHAEYAPAEENGEPPPANSPLWILAGGGTTTQNALGTFPFQEVLFLGADPGGTYPHSGAIARHLTPGTAYYARFHAENAEGMAEKTFAFTTTAVTKPEVAKFQVAATGPTSAAASAQIETNGAQTEYRFEYAPAEGGHAPAEESPSWTLFTSGATGTITVAEEFAIPEAKLTGLTPETEYFARVRAVNEKGTVIETHSSGVGHEDGSFTTPTDRPLVGTPDVRNVTGTSAHLRANILPHGSETTWRFEYATSENGPWTPVAGAEGTISQAEAQALPENVGAPVEGTLTSLTPATVYYVRLFAENTAGEAKTCHEETNPGPEYGQIVCEPISTATHGILSFKTFGSPAAATFAVHGLHGEALRIIGAVNPNSVPTSGEQVITVEGAPTGGTFTLTFKGQTTAPIAFDAPAEGPNGLSQALNALPATAGEVLVTGPSGGPYTVYFYGRNGEVKQSQITADASSLTPAGTVTVATVQEGGEAYDTSYRFEYVSQKQFEAPGGEGGFAKASSTPPVDIGSGASTEYAGADLPGLEPGETYRFRILATSTSPGNPVVQGEAQVLTVPTPPAPGEAGACTNTRLRSGPSANLPGCRAFEQLTPVDKGGAQEIFNYGGNLGNEGARPGEDGDRLEYGSLPVKWGAGPRAGQSPYFFSRGEGSWQMIGATTQPEAGVYHYRPQVFAPDLTAFAFEASWFTSPSSPSPRIEFKAGSPGGPYVTATSVPRAQAEPGWVAASKDFSKLVLAVTDRTLLGPSTHTQEGVDLYEWSRGELRQANVTGPAPGVTVGSCGATIAGGSEAGGATTGSRAVSDDGSRVFFEAVPGKACSDPKHLYMRVNGSETVDIGVYKFIAVDSGGSRVLMEKPSGENSGLYLYDTESATAGFLPSSGVAVGASFTVSEDLSTVYIRAGVREAPALYRYDIRAERLLLVTQFSVGGNGRVFYSSSPDGRYFYFVAETVAGLPAGGQELETPHAAIKGQTSQVFRYDSAEALVQCISCASPFDPEPRLSALFAEGSGKTVASANGDYAFFDTPTALAPADVDGEIAPEGIKANGGEHGSSNYSLSSDVYEWRRVGVDGCSHPQGCLALITSGGGGFLNILLGTTASGRDVFFSTNESLLPSDNDTAGDIYDARIGGGFAEPSRAAQCEGDACSTPFAAPSDPTPSSSTFHGVGNVRGAPLPKVKAKPKRKVKHRCRARSKSKCKAKHKKRTGKAKRAAGHAVRTGGRHAMRTGGEGR